MDQDFSYPAKGTAPEALKRIRASASKIYLAFLWCFIPIITGINIAMGNSIWIMLALTMVVSLFVTFMVLRNPSDRYTRYSMGTGLAATWVMLVTSLSGSPDGFILEGHMVFFVLITMMIAYFCWRTLLIL
ncbi:MAG: hypothetical protein R3261_05520, partial [Alphaproteobacteria bacterium]|nr:hypothetical protein [Alphaproteobacteria bacterium]